MSSTQVYVTGPHKYAASVRTVRGDTTWLHGRERTTYNERPTDQTYMTVQDGGDILFDVFLKQHYDKDDECGENETGMTDHDKKKVHFSVDADTFLRVTIRNRSEKSLVIMPLYVPDEGELDYDQDKLFFDGDTPNFQSGMKWIEFGTQKPEYRSILHSDYISEKLRAQHHVNREACEKFIETLFGEKFSDDGINHIKEYVYILQTYDPKHYAEKIEYMREKFQEKYGINRRQYNDLMHHVKGQYELSRQELDELSRQELDELPETMQVYMKDVFIKVDGIYYIPENKNLICELPPLQKKEGESMDAWRLVVEGVGGTEQNNTEVDLEFNIKS